LYLYTKNSGALPQLILILWYPSKIFCGTPAKYFVVPQQNILWYPSKIFCGTPAKCFVVPQQNILWYLSKIFCGTPAKYFVVPQQNILWYPSKVFCGTPGKYFYDSCSTLSKNIGSVPGNVTIFLFSKEFIPVFGAHPAIY